LLLYAGFSSKFFLFNELKGVLTVKIYANFGKFSLKENREKKPVKNRENNAFLCSKL
jgi:hypothetical protein